MSISSQDADEGVRETWHREDDPGDAVARLLDAAAGVFATKGVTGTRLADVARAAGCARGTVYRYFPDRDALRRAFVEREATRVGLAVAERLASEHDADPGVRLVEAIVVAVELVRNDPVLAEWFDLSAAATAGNVAARTPVIADLVRAFLHRLFGDAHDLGILRREIDHELAVDWVIRIVLSLLTQPVPSEASDRSSVERRQLEAFLVPALFTGARDERSAPQVASMMTSATASRRRGG